MTVANDSRMEDLAASGLKGKDMDIVNDTLLSIAYQDDRHRIESLTQQLLDLQQLHFGAVESHKEEKAKLLDQIKQIECEYA